MVKNKAKQFAEEFNSLTDKFAKMLRDMLDKEKNNIRIDEDTYREIAGLMLEYDRYLRVRIKILYNDFVNRKDKIDIYEFTEFTEAEKIHIKKVEDEFYYSKCRWYIEYLLTKINKLLDLTKDLENNNKLHKTYEAMAKCRRKIKLQHSMEAVGESVENTVGKVFKKAIIPAVSKGANLAKEGYYAGMDELGKKVDVAYDNFYKEMKSKPTSTLLDYYNNRDLNDNQIAIIEQVLDERGAL